MKLALKRISVSRYGWFGNYSSWEEASNECVGYNSDVIFDKVKAATQLVRKGEAKYERDSVLFFEEEYNWQLLACLELIALRENGTLHVTDFGGSLGSFFFQHRRFFSFFKEVKWGVVEQSHFVEYGNENLVDEGLSFYHTTKGCLEKQSPQTLFLSSVLQYLESPFETIKDLLRFPFKYILIDRTAFTKKEDNEITIQKVDPKIYDASYPAWFFNEEKFLRQFSNDYEILFSFKNDDFTNRHDTYFKGYLLIKRELSND